MTFILSYSSLLSFSLLFLTNLKQERRSFHNVNERDLDTLLILHWKCDLTSGGAIAFQSTSHYICQLYQSSATLPMYYSASGLLQQGLLIETKNETVLPSPVINFWIHSTPLQTEPDKQDIQSLCSGPFTATLDRSSLRSSIVKVS